MGAWPHEPFGNDDAGDWACELEETEDLSYVEAALGCSARIRARRRLATACGFARGSLER